MTGDLISVSPRQLPIPTCPMHQKWLFISLLSRYFVWGRVGFLFLGQKTVFWIGIYFILCFAKKMLNISLEAEHS